MAIIGKKIEVSEGKATQATHQGEKYLLTLVKGKYIAYKEKCPHIGLSLAKGKIKDGAVVCPYHGSSYDLLTGQNKDWVNSFAGIKMPKWSHKIISLGKKPAPLEVHILKIKGDDLIL